MKLSNETIGNILSRYAEDGQHVYDWCGQYGEPGYHDRETFVVLGDWWCRCPKFGLDKNGRPELHTIEQHRPRLFQAMEEAGVEFVWHDEWMVATPYDKAYRTQGDSYSWQPSVIYPEDGDPLTPDDDIEDWTDALANNPRQCIPSRIFSEGDLTEAGWTRFNDETYQNGWHPGQTDDPTDILEAVKVAHPDADVVFHLDYNSQFDLGFSAWYREVS